MQPQRKLKRARHAPCNNQKHTFDLLEVAESPLRIGSFNLQAIGGDPHKAKSKDTTDTSGILANILQRYDLLLLMEARTGMETNIDRLIRNLNVVDRVDPFDFEESEAECQLHGVKEHYCFFYRVSKLSVLEVHHYGDDPFRQVGWGRSGHVSPRGSVRSASQESSVTLKRPGHQTDKQPQAGSVGMPTPKIPYPPGFNRGTTEKGSLPLKSVSDSVQQKKPARPATCSQSPSLQEGRMDAAAKEAAGYIPSEDGVSGSKGGTENTNVVGSLKDSKGAFIQQCVVDREVCNPAETSRGFGVSIGNEFQEPVEFIDDESEAEERSPYVSHLLRRESEIDDWAEHDITLKKSTPSMNLLDFQKDPIKQPLLSGLQEVSHESGESAKYLVEKLKNHNPQCFAKDESQFYVVQKSCCAATTSKEKDEQTSKQEPGPASPMVRSWPEEGGNNEVIVATLGGPVPPIESFDSSHDMAKKVFVDPIVFSFSRVPFAGCPDVTSFQGNEPYMGGPNNVFQGNQQYTAGPNNAFQGNEPYTGGPNNVFQGNEPYTGGPNNAFQGNEPYTGGPNNAFQGNQQYRGGLNNVFQGNEPYMGGPNNAFQGNEPYTGGPNNAFQGNQQYRGGPNNVFQGNEPYMGGPNNAFQGNQQYTAGPNIVFQGNEPYTGGPNNAFQGNEPYMGGPNNAFQGNEPYMGGPNNAFQGNEPYMGGPNNAFQRNEPYMGGPNNALQGNEPYTGGPNNTFQGSQQYTGGPNNVFQGNQQYRGGPNNVFQGNEPYTGGSNNVLQGTEHCTAGPNNVFQGTEQCTGGPNNALQENEPYTGGSNNAFQGTEQCTGGPNNALQGNEPYTGGFNNAFQGTEQCTGGPNNAFQGNEPYMGGPNNAFQGNEPYTGDPNNALQEIPEIGIGNTNNPSQVQEQQPSSQDQQPCETNAENCPAAIELSNSPELCGHIVNIVTMEEGEEDSSNTISYTNAGQDNDTANNAQGSVRAKRIRKDDIYGNIHQDRNQQNNPAPDIDDELSSDMESGTGSQVDANNLGRPKSSKDSQNSQNSGSSAGSPSDSLSSKAYVRFSRKASVKFTPNRFQSYSIAETTYPEPEESACCCPFRRRSKKLKIFQKEFKVKIKDAGNPANTRNEDTKGKNQNAHLINDCSFHLSQTKQTENRAASITPNTGIIDHRNKAKACFNDDRVTRKEVCADHPRATRSDTHLQALADILDAKRHQGKGMYGEDSPMWHHYEWCRCHPKYHQDYSDQASDSHFSTSHKQPQTGQEKESMPVKSFSDHLAMRTHDNGHLERLSTDLGHLERLSTDLGHLERLSTGLGNLERLSTGLGHSERLSTDLGNLERLSTDLGHSERLSTGLGHSERLSTDLGNLERLSTGLGNLERLSTDLGNLERLSTGLGHSERLSTGLGHSERLSTGLPQQHSNSLQQDTSNDVQLRGSCEKARTVRTAKKMDRTICQSKDIDLKHEHHRKLEKAKPSPEKQGSSRKRVELGDTQDETKPCVLKEPTTTEEIQRNMCPEIEISPTPDIKTDICNNTRNLNACACRSHPDKGIHEEEEEPSTETFTYATENDKEGKKSETLAQCVQTEQNINSNAGEKDRRHARKRGEKWEENGNRSGLISVFCREPFAVLFQSSSTEVTSFAIIAIHTDSNDARKEAMAIQRLYDVTATKWHTENVVMVGDFVMVESSRGMANWRGLEIKSDRRFCFASSNLTTSLSASQRNYDRMVVAGLGLNRSFISSDVGFFRYDTAFKVPAEMMAQMGDHFPIEIQLAGLAKTRWQKHVRPSVGVVIEQVQHAPAPVGFKSTPTPTAASAGFLMELLVDSVSKRKKEIRVTRKSVSNVMAALREFQQVFPDVLKDPTLAVAASLLGSPCLKASPIYGFRFGSQAPSYDLEVTLSQQAPHVVRLSIQRPLYDGFRSQEDELPVSEG